MTSKWITFTKDSFQTVIDRRKEAMGIAMVMVVFYHFAVVFYAGFLGVDIFLFLSAYGLCQSFETNSLATFYRRRAIRIVPMYVVFGILFNVIYIFYYHYDFGLWDLFCNISSLNYWKLGGLVSEWYLSFLIVFYLFFPILFYIVDRTGGVSLVLVLIFTIYFLTVGLDWNYDTAIGRMPIIVLGIMCYDSKRNIRKPILLGMRLFAIAFVCSVILYIYRFVHLYVIFYMLSPIVIMMVGYFINCLYKEEKVNKVLRFIGEHSLEIYIANILVCHYKRNSQSLFSSLGVFSSALLYFSLNMLIALVLIKVSKVVAIYINK